MSSPAPDEAELEEEEGAPSLSIAIAELVLVWVLVGHVDVPDELDHVESEKGKPLLELGLLPGALFKPSPMAEGCSRSGVGALPPCVHC